jgi:hypothetical protein
VYDYVFVQKDPRLMAMPHRRLIGVVLMVIGFSNIVLAGLLVSGRY